MAPVVAFAGQEQTPQVQTGRTAIPEATVGKAAAALHDVAQLQGKYQEKMEKAQPEQKQSLNELANAEAAQAIQSHGLSVQEYTQVIHVAQNDPQLKRRLLDAANEK